MNNILHPFVSCRINLVTDHVKHTWRVVANVLSSFHFSFLNVHPSYWLLYSARRVLWKHRRVSLALPCLVARSLTRSSHLPLYYSPRGPLSSSAIWFLKIRKSRQMPLFCQKVNLGRWLTNVRYTCPHALNLFQKSIRYVSTNRRRTDSMHVSVQLQRSSFSLLSLSLSRLIQACPTRGPWTLFTRPALYNENWNNWTRILLFECSSCPSYKGALTFANRFFSHTKRPKTSSASWKYSSHYSLSVSNQILIYWTNIWKSKLGVLIFIFFLIIVSVSFWSIVSL